MSRVFDPLTLFAAATAILLSCPAWGQTTGSRAGSGSSLTSGLGFGNASFGNSSLGGGLGQGGVGQSGFGQGGFGQSGFGSTGFGSQTGFGQSGSGFVGRDGSEVSAMFENMAREGQQFMNRVERSINRNSRNNRNTVEATRQQVKVRLKVGFEYPNPASSPMQADFDSRVAELLANRKVANVTLERDGQGVILGGVAANEFERIVVEQIVAQQPGVITVTNRMTIGEPLAVPTPQE